MARRVRVESIGLVQLYRPCRLLKTHSRRQERPLPEMGDFPEQTGPGKSRVAGVWL